MPQILCPKCSLLVTVEPSGEINSHRDCELRRVNELLVPTLITDLQREIERMRAVNGDKIETRRGKSRRGNKVRSLKDIEVSKATKVNKKKKYPIVSSSFSGPHSFKEISGGLPGLGKAK